MTTALNRLIASAAEPKPVYLVVEDFARVSIGPFATTEAAREHFDWTKEQGDGANFIAMREGSHDPEAHLTMTPEEDKASDRA